MTLVVDRAFRLSLIKDILMQWVKDGMTLEEAQALWKEMDEHDRTL